MAKAAGTGRPKFALASAPHSPLAAGSSRSQSGMKFRLLSAHDRVVLVNTGTALAAGSSDDRPLP